GWAADEPLEPILRESLTILEEFRCAFPTRRSSDLFHLRGNQRTNGETSRKEGGKIFGSGSRAPIAISLLVKNPDAQAHGKIYFQDRKSTRLNSSHVKISYAVFCLKKKNHEQSTKTG